jgi:hypothetical protein
MSKKKEENGRTVTVEQEPASARRNREICSALAKSKTGAWIRNPERENDLTRVHSSRKSSTETAGHGNQAQKTKATGGDGQNKSWAPGVPCEWEIRSNKKLKQENHAGNENPKLD